VKNYINVFSLPRSGTNLFASFMSRHPKIISYNVGGGRFPLRPNYNSKKNQIIISPQIKKEANKDTFYLRDELKFNFIGPKIYWPEQYVFKIYLKFFKRFNKNKIILLRNPYSIAASMNDYYKKNKSHAHAWNMNDMTQITKFTNNFSDLVFQSKKFLNQGGIIVDPYLFFSDDRRKIDVYKYLAIDSHQSMQKIGQYRNTFDQKEIFEYGGFNPQAKIAAERLLTKAEYLQTDFLDLIKIQLDNLLGNEISKCFHQSGHTDHDKLLSLIQK